MSTLMSQSGAFITAIVDWANDHGIGFKDIVSLGNKAVLDETDFLEVWGEDPDTDVIIGYLEGIDDGQAFIETAREVTQETPIVLTKSGRTDAGAQAASSHTGELAGSDRAYEAGFEQAGILRAESMQELFDAAQALSGQPLPDTDGVAIVTNAGGPGVMAADAVGDSPLSIASFTDETRRRLEETLPDAASFHNPVDILGDADIERFREAISILIEDEHVGAILVISAPTAVLDYDSLADVILVTNFEQLGDLDELLAAIDAAGDQLAGVIFNAVRDTALDTLERDAIPFLESRGHTVFGVLPHERELAGVTVDELASELGAQQLTEGSSDAFVERFLVGAMSSDMALRHFRRSRHTAVITGGDRAEIHTAAIEAPGVDCLVLTGGQQPSGSILGKAEQAGMPVLAVTMDTIRAVEQTEQVIQGGRTRNAATVHRMQTLLETHADVDSILEM